MKKALAIGILAITAIALSQQQASAWVNTRFGIGPNWEYQSGGNNWGWGAFRNGQPPGPEALGGYGHSFPQHGPTDAGSLVIAKLRAGSRRQMPMHNRTANRSSPLPTRGPCTTITAAEESEVRGRKSEVRDQRSGLNPVEPSSDL